MLAISPSVEHPSRRELNDEVHARPPDNLPTPSAVSYIARVPARGISSAPADTLADLLRRFEVAPPAADAKHFSTVLDAVRLRWERHTEYNRYTFMSAAAGEPFSVKPAASLPGDWLSQMHGEVLVGMHAWIAADSDVGEDIDAIADRYFNGNVLIGSRTADDGAIALTDLHIHGDGCSRLLLINTGMSDAQTGRVMQRLLEIETYRMMALLALPVAQELMPIIDADEREMVDIGAALVDVEAHQEQELLERITRLSAESQNRHLRSNYRFAAADAYYEIVLQRIHELRESRIPGLQTFEEFTTRRLAPAVKTYRAVSKRQQSILEQTARATSLLSTRIDIARQQQSQSLLASMNRRVKAQLRLQATVEGLSVAAVTYYVVGLVGILAAGAAALGAGVDRAIVMGASIPLVAAVAFFGIRRLKKKISEDES